MLFNSTIDASNLDREQLFENRNNYYYNSFEFIVDETAIPLMDVEVENSVNQVGELYKIKSLSNFFYLDPRTNKLYYTKNINNMNWRDGIEIERDTHLSLRDKRNNYIVDLTIKEINISPDTIIFTCYDKDFNKNDKDLSQIKGSYEKIKVSEIMEKIYDFDNMALVCWKSTIPYLIIEDYLKPKEIFNLLQSAYQENMFIYSKRVFIDERLNPVNDENKGDLKNILVLFVGWQVWNPELIREADVVYNGNDMTNEEMKEEIALSYERQQNNFRIFTMDYNQNQNEWFQDSNIDEITNEPVNTETQKTPEDLAKNFNQMISNETNIYEYPFLSINYDHVAFGDRIKVYAIAIGKNAEQKKESFPENFEDNEAEKIITVNFAFDVPQEELKSLARTAYYNNYNNSYNINLETLLFNKIPKFELGDRVLVRVRKGSEPILFYIDKIKNEFNEGGSRQKLDLIIDRTTLSWEERTDENKKNNFDLDGLNAYNSVYDVLPDENIT